VEEEEVFSVEKETEVEMKVYNEVHMEERESEVAHDDVVVIVSVVS
jgi:hypothetical protein